MIGTIYQDDDVSVPVLMSFVPARMKSHQILMRSVNADLLLICLFSFESVETFWTTPPTSSALFVVFAYFFTW